MKKLIIVTAGALALAGCQTRITAEKNPEQMLPVYAVSGTNVYVKGYERASGGWYATARSPLWATEELRGLSIGVHTNGSVTLALDAYNRDLSTNAVTLAHNLVTDFAILAEKVGAAYASCGGTIIAAKGKSALQKAMASYLAKGGTANGATVTCENGNCTITGGGITEVCTDCFDN